MRTGIGEFCRSVQVGSAAQSGVAEHPRAWARGATITDPVHVETAAWLRKQFQQPRAVGAGGDDLARDLSDYDRAFGLNAEDGIG